MPWSQEKKKKTWQVNQLKSGTPSKEKQFLECYRVRTDFSQISQLQDTWHIQAEINFTEMNHLPHIAHFELKNLAYGMFHLVRIINNKFFTMRPKEICCEYLCGYSDT